jgi:hypothetical protein
VDKYPAKFRGFVGGNPMTGGLSPLGQRVLDILWNSMKKLKDSQHIFTERDKQEALCSQKADAFVARQKMLDNLMQKINSCEGGIVHLSGVPGSGTTSLLCKAYKDLSHKQRMNHKIANILLPCFIEAFVGNDDERDVETRMLLYLFKQLMSSLGLSGSTSDTDTRSIKSSRSLCTNIANLLQCAKTVNVNPNAKVILFVDGLECFSSKNETSSASSRKNVSSLDWLPGAVPPGVVLVISTHHGSKWDKFVSSRYS